MSQLKFTETVLRDGHQSQIATRMTIDEIVPILPVLDEIGYHALEVWGGATFDVCLRYLNENPWERLRTIRKHIKNTQLQMLLRGQNLLGYKHYANDVVDRFIGKSVENGIDIIRVFDALNDLRNIERSVQATKRESAHSQCAIAYTTSPVHTIDYYCDISQRMEEMGADSICIKDMAGILIPETASELIQRLKESVNIPLELHGHSTSGICEMTYMKAAVAGIDILDTALSPFSGGTAQPATESQYNILSTYRDTVPLNVDKLEEAAKYFKSVKDTHISCGNFNPRVMMTEPKILSYQVPGGMLSNLLSQLKDQGMDDRFEEVLEEIPKVRKDLGYPPLVTPLSQMVGTQAVFNIITGERYKLFPKEIRAYCKGLYGMPPAPIDKEIQNKAIGEETFIHCCPADLLPDAYEEAALEIKDLSEEEEMVLAYLLFPEYARAYLEGGVAANEPINLEIVVG